MALWGMATGLSSNQEPPQQNNLGKQPPSDPFAFGTGPYKAKKKRHIGDYITNMYSVDPSYEDDSTVTIGGLEFSLAKGKKVPQEKIRVQHYMEGALRILREMILEDDMPVAQIVNHLNYLIQVACFSQTTAWRRVLNYDTVYRREQHDHGFAWGTGSAFLMQSQLVQPDLQTQGNQPNKRAPTSNTKKSGGTPANVIHPKSGKPVCGRWNSASGCNGEGCHYAHVCKKCFAENHTQSFHWDQSTSEAPKK